MPSRVNEFVILALILYNTNIICPAHPPILQLYFIAQKNYKTRNLKKNL